MPNRVALPRSDVRRSLAVTHLLLAVQTTSRSEHEPGPEKLNLRPLSSTTTSPSDPIERARGHSGDGRPALLLPRRRPGRCGGGGARGRAATPPARPAGLPRTAPARTPAPRPARPTTQALACPASCSVLTRRGQTTDQRDLVGRRARADPDRTAYEDRLPVLGAGRPADLPEAEHLRQLLRQRLGSVEVQRRLPVGRQPGLGPPGVLGDEIAEKDLLSAVVPKHGQDVRVVDREAPGAAQRSGRVALERCSPPPEPAELSSHLCSMRRSSSGRRRI